MSARRPVARAVPAAVATLAVTALAACSPDEPTLEVVSEGTVRTVADLASLEGGEPLLQLVGADGTSVDLSREHLDAMRTVSAELYEPFVRERVTFTGVPLSDLFAMLGDLDPEGTVHAVALNEYSVEIPVSVTREDGAFLATLEDGEPIAVEDGGPTRVVFTDDHPDTANETLWIWSLASLDVS